MQVTSTGTVDGMMAALSRWCPVNFWNESKGGLDERRASRSGGRKTKRDFAFSGLIKCGYCGCALVGELEKKWYVYLPFLGGLRLATAEQSQFHVAYRYTGIPGAVAGTTKARHG